MNIPRPLVLAALLPTVALLSAETCGPVGGLQPMYAPGAVIEDDSLVGEYAVIGADRDKKKSKKPTTAKIVKENTADGISYVLTLREADANMKNVQFRMFLIDINGARFADVLTEDTKAASFAASWVVPQHLYFRVVRTPGAGVALEHLDNKWLDAEIARDPKAVPTLELPRNYAKRDDGSLVVERTLTLTGDAASIKALHGRALPIDSAWSVGIELARKGQPALDFTLTSTTHESSKDSSTTEATLTVAGSKITYATATSGRDAGSPKNKPVNAVGRLKDLTRIDGLVRAFLKTKVTKPEKPLPKPLQNVTTKNVCVAISGAPPRCAERLVGDESGADVAALEALRAAIMEDVKFTP